MKAICYREFGGPDVLHLEDLPRPEMADDQILVRVHVAGVNFADTMKRRNLYPGPTAAMPVIPGFEAAGVVESCGKSVKRFRPGDRVLALADNGCYSEFVSVAQSSAYLLPLTISFEQAVALPGQGLTAYFLLQEVFKQKDACSVLIHAAAGGVGLLAMQLARMLGAEVVVGTAGSAEKVQLIESEELGAAVDYTNPNWPNAALALNNGKKFDVILDSVGGDILQASLPLLADKGELVVYGRASGAPFNFDPVQLLSGNRKVRGFSLNGYLHDRLAIEAALAALFDYVAQDLLKLYVSGRFSLEEASLVHTLMESRKTTGKLVLAV